MQKATGLKLISLMCFILGIVIYGFTFDRGLFAFTGPTIFLIGAFVSFYIIKNAHGTNKAIIPIMLWVLAIIVNRITGSYDFYSNYDFIDPLSGFLLSAILALVAFSLTIYYFFKHHK